MTPDSIGIFVVAYVALRIAVPGVCHLAQHIDIGKIRHWGPPTLGDWENMRLGHWDIGRLGHEDIGKLDEAIGTLGG